VDGGGDDIESSRGKAHSVSNVDIERTKWKRKYVSFSFMFSF
jgi:hypothetical protein